MLIFVPLFDSGKFFGSRSRLDGSCRAWGSTRKMTPEAFRLNGVFETDRKYGPIEAIGIELRNRQRKGVIEGSGGDGHSSGM